MNYEALIEDHHGHLFHYRYQANSDQEAINKANEDGFGMFGDDTLWRVEGEYVDYSNFNVEEQRKMKEHYIKIMT